MREQIFKTTDIIGYSTDSGSVIDTTLHNVLTTLNFMPEGIQDNLCVGYEHESDGIDIYEIYNNATGEVYWNKNNPNWNERDESLVDSLLMWGELSQRNIVDEIKKLLIDLNKKLDDLKFRGAITYGEPNHIRQTHFTFDLKLDGVDEDGQRLNEPKPYKPKPEPEPLVIKKMQNTDWLNFMEYFKMLFDGFQRADWSNSEVRQQISSVMVKKIKTYLKENFPDFVEETK